MRMDDVKQDSHAHLMCPINQRLELLGRSCKTSITILDVESLTIARGDSEEVGNLITEGCLGSEDDMRQAQTCKRNRHAP